ncbi:hypothetical protein [Spiroplasma gladiatoris]|uniref:hypothetical protein n=1 Tax=Spiroplasma gladiatoris TaxID=2143 RepID=UPI001067F125|nr:hypothetical protein [Spiroplasma gladiatoris]
MDKVYGDTSIDIDEWLKKVGNTSVFTENELKEEYKKGRKLIIKFFYIFSFGEGKNITFNYLSENNIWPKNYYLLAHPIKDKELYIKKISSKLWRYLYWTILFRWSWNYNWSAWGSCNI